MRQARPLLPLALCVALGAQACKRRTPDTSDPQPTPPAHTTEPTPTSPDTLGAQGGPQAATARQDLNGPNYTLVVGLAPIPSPGDTTFNFELHGTTGYHVNEQYPIAIELELANATASKSTLRREDAAEYTQAGARFAFPIHTTAPGARVQGRARFAVCSAENCVPETRTFAVALP
ncbi:MAG: hypothetical protein HY909_02800 [Deltaproteobacteria bacterium]|nr:hypothetical protein [Deltaproteobacteria bacterium]